MKHLTAAILMGLALGAAPAPALADGPVTLVVPYPPGGASDYLGRVLAPAIEELGQQVVVLNQPGAGTAIGARAVASAEPDGQTLLLATSTTLAINPSLYPDLTYDPVADFTTVELVADVPFVLIASPQMQAGSLEDVLAVARERELSFGSAGNGSPHHLFMELLRSRTHFDAVHVPYQGSGAAITDLLGGQIDLMMSDLAPALPHIQSGALKAIAVSTAERLPMLPDVPTLQEAGVPDYEATAWQGVVGPKDMPAETVEALKGALREAVADPAVAERLAAGGILVRTSEVDFPAFIRSEIARWAEVVKASGASIN